MNNINWKVRFKNKAFWLALIPALALVLQAVLDLVGLRFDFGETVNKLIVLVNVVFALLAILGIVQDPTTQGLSDSERALNYTEPSK